MLTAAQFEARAEGLGGSDAAAVAGLNPYKSPVDVWLEKTGQVDPPDLSDNQRVYWGNKLEDIVADVYAERTGCRVRRRAQTFRHKRHPFLLGHIDRSVDGSRRGLECKTADRWTAHMWGEDRSDEIPEYYLMQCVHYMAITGYDAWDLAVLIGGNDFRVFTIQRHKQLEENLVELEVDFWRNHVEAGVAPPPTRDNDLKLLYPRDSGRLITATPEISLAVEQLRMLKAGIKTSQAEADDLELQIKSFMGDAAEMLLDTDGKTRLATWKSIKDSEVVDLDALRNELPEVVANYMKPRAPQRRFNLKKIGA
jgi:putative phage-type endonuclease